MQDYTKMPLLKLIHLIKRNNDQQALREWRRRWEDDYPRIRTVKKV
ncbi:hypothetical protein ACFFJY_07970 [Fictibacillus aquaticus]|nr:hypothetical protein [Fictibacillus aquaticus]